MKYLKWKYTRWILVPVGSFLGCYTIARIVVNQLVEAENLDLLERLERFQDRLFDEEEPMTVSEARTVVQDFVARYAHPPSSEPSLHLQYGVEEEITSPELKAFQEHDGCFQYSLVGPPGTCLVDPENALNCPNAF